MMNIKVLSILSSVLLLFFFATVVQARGLRELEPCMYADTGNPCGMANQWCPVRKCRCETKTMTWSCPLLYESGKPECWNLDVNKRCSPKQVGTTCGSCTCNNFREWECAVSKDTSSSSTPTCHSLDPKFGPFTTTCTGEVPTCLLNTVNCPVWNEDAATCEPNSIDQKCDCDVESGHWMCAMVSCMECPPWPQ